MRILASICHRGRRSNRTKPGALIGSSAGVPPPGIYMFNQVFTYQANLAGPGTAALNPPGTHKTGVQAAVDVPGFLFVPGWTFLGATYDAVIVQPFVDAQPRQGEGRTQAAGMFNTYIVPVHTGFLRSRPVSVSTSMTQP